MADTQHRLATRLAALFQRLAESQVDAYLVLSSDAHLNEYGPIYQRRRAAITGFTGSAGDALLCPEGSHLFVDSRYYLQADQEVDPAYFRVHKLGMEGAYTLTGWLTEMERQRGSLRVGFDPFSTSTEAYTSYAKALKDAASALVPLTPNLVDAVWEDCPAPPAQPIYSLPDEVTGRSVADKLTAIRAEMAKAGADVLIFTKLDEIAWVTNLRGSDVSHNPVFRGVPGDRARARPCFPRVAPPAKCSRPWHPRSCSRTTYLPRDCAAPGRHPELTVWLDAAGTTMGTRLLLAETQRLHTARNPVV
jgi:Xaa-Pro aminopeptidase